MIITMTIIESAPNYDKVLHLSGFDEITVLSCYGCFKKIQDAFTNPSFTALEKLLQHLGVLR